MVAEIRLLDRYISLYLLNLANSYLGSQILFMGA
jgi:hypothetical protein